MREATDQIVERALTIQVNRNKEFIGELAAFMSGLQQTAEAEGDEEGADEADEADEANTSMPATPTGAAIAAYIRAVRAQARAAAGKRQLGRNTLSAKIVGWLGTRSLGELDLIQLGTSLRTQGALRNFVNPCRRYVGGISRRYRTYRRVHQNEGRWYHPDGFGQADLHPLELDVLVLATLRVAY